jgi:hypothetical protein
MPPESSSNPSRANLEYEHPHSVPVPGLYRDEDLLVAPQAADFSRTCVCCGRPAEGKPLTKTFPSGQQESLRVPSGGTSGGGGCNLVMLLIYLVGAALFVISETALEKERSLRRRITYGLCHAHRHQRRTMILAGAVVGVISGGLFLGGLIVTIVMSNSQSGLTTPLPPIAAVLGLVLGWLGGRPLLRRTPRLALARESDEHFWLKGAGPAFLEAQEPWQGKSEIRSLK